MLDLMPILSSLRRQKLAAALIVLEIALSCAIITNAMHVIERRYDAVTAPSGLAEAELITVRVGRIGLRDDKSHEPMLRDLAALRALPHVRNVALASAVPFMGNDNQSSISLDGREASRQFNVAMYDGTLDLLPTLGAAPSEGRGFTAEELQTSEREPAPVVIVNRPLAEALFPGQSALGKQLYGEPTKPLTIVGIVDRLDPPNPSLYGDRERYVMVGPHVPARGAYLLRVDPDQRDRTLVAALDALERVAPNRVILDQGRLDTIRARYSAPDRAMLWVMTGVIAALLLVTALGIVGLASFWVQQRTRMIGIRRALGASERQILRYFQLENALLTCLGSALGVLGAYALGLLLMLHWELPPLPLKYLPASALLLCTLGQLAVWRPAHRAAALPPVAALRS